jgi:hypothetical protein
MNSVEERAARERKKRERLAASLRETLKRRKAQQRSRAGSPLAPIAPPPASEAEEG